MVDVLPFNDVEPSEWHEISSSRSILDPKTLCSRSYDGHPQISIVNNIATHLMKQERRSYIWEKKIQDVSRLLRQPPEIIFEVFTHLHPLDLYHLARTTKKFRSLIMNRASAWLWELVFARNPEIPSCPPEFSFPRWTNLLFGPTICEKCTTHEDNLNMTMRQRVCTSCEPWVRMSNGDDFAAALSRWESSTTRRGEWSREGIRQLGLILGACEELMPWNHEAVAQLATLQEDESTRDMVASIVLTRASWEKLKKKAIISMLKDKREMEITVLSNINRRLAKLGYSDADRQRLFSEYPSCFQSQFDIDVKNPARYIRRNWPSLRRRIESSMTELREQFEMIEHQRIVSRRKSVIQNVYYESFNFDTSFPTAQGVQFFEPFYTLVNSPTSESLDPLEIKEEILKFTDRWPPQTIEGLLNILPSRERHSDLADLSLKIPSTIFTCTACTTGDCLVGWKEMVAHQRACCTSHLPFQCRVSERGSVAAQKILQFITRDVPADQILDIPPEADGFFCCGTCVNLQRPAYHLSWREYIQHSVDTDDDVHHKQLRCWLLGAGSHNLYFRGGASDT